MIALGADHGGFLLKEAIKAYLEQENIAYHDFGTYSEDSVDYAPIAEQVAHAVANGEAEKGILCCGTGIGISIAANKVKGAYAACIHDVYQAQRAQLSNHANIITMGSQVIGIELAKQLVKEYLSVEWDPNCRSVAKVQRIIDFENEE